MKYYACINMPLWNQMYWMLKNLNDKTLIYEKEGNFTEYLH